MNIKKVTKGIVLGGGGQVGRAWLAGLVSQLIETGVKLQDSDVIIGTSAGSQIGAQIALGTLDLKNAPTPPEKYVDFSTVTSDAFTNLYTMLADAALAPNPVKVLKEVGKCALNADTMSEDQAMHRLSYLNGYNWPENFKTTAVSALTGKFHLLDKDSDITLKLAVASSSALPGVFPPVSINGDRYMDGGVRSMINADLAIGNELVLVVSCFSLEVSSAHTAQDILNNKILEEIQTLKENGSTVKLISPNSEFKKLTKNGTEMLNLSLMPDAWHIGRNQALDEGKDIDVRWMM
ncbi:patatin-like phospholipase family protein [Pedobacter cryoconitis]|uniref:NTE family protein n=1 Tax=Pedobacter cryoconitis TaxID=188932 RepID=A0A7X0ML78_9SPHI|nr:patatin-like phospholipase family protein [Pedobacter cryoconitis]MBB6502816.1 NTE family protein [Pedobacter cryoconitis]